MNITLWRNWKTTNRFHNRQKANNVSQEIVNIKNTSK